jgi:hypothetical protein
MLVFAHQWPSRARQRTDTAYRVIDRQRPIGVEGDVVCLVHTMEGVSDEHQRVSQIGLYLIAAVAALTDLVVVSREIKPSYEIAKKVWDTMVKDIGPMARPKRFGSCPTCPRRAPARSCAA